MLIERTSLNGLLARILFVVQVALLLLGTAASQALFGVAPESVGSDASAQVISNAMTTRGFIVGCIAFVMLGLVSHTWSGIIFTGLSMVVAAYLAYLDYGPNGVPLLFMLAAMLGGVSALATVLMRLNPALFGIGIAGAAALYVAWPKIF